MDKLGNLYASSFFVVLEGPLLWVFFLMKKVRMQNFTSPEKHFLNTHIEANCRHVGESLLCVPKSTWYTHVSMCIPSDGPAALEPFVDLPVPCRLCTTAGQQSQPSKGAFPGSQHCA